MRSPALPFAAPSVLLACRGLPPGPAAPFLAFALVECHACPLTTTSHVAADTGREQVLVRHVTPAGGNAIFTSLAPAFSVQTLRCQLKSVVLLPD